ncbi:MAG TPA: pantoate--beta-alanine ligase [Candidatus Manganitrophaceae bacterium]|nr:pantoate--beta-alanine ligase [Candidatus Manganitrophaceae bacterium]
MKTVSRIQTLQKILAPLRGKKKVGLVPTMGALHEGHLSLIRRAKRECGCVVVSLFVNPLQFGPKEDFKTYPRDLPGDRKKAASAGADLLWAPSVEEMFPPGHQTFVEVEGVGRRWEGASRPGHFRGVATVVAKLFQIVRPDRVYLGQKDYQQTRVILRMVRDLAFDLSVRICPTLREKDGLAMSSRNQRLSAEERKAAPVLYKALRNGEALIREGERESRRVIQRMEEVIRSEARAKIDYIALADPETLEPIDRIAGRVVLLGGVKIGAVRLIDNLVMNIHE